MYGRKIMNYEQGRIREEVVVRYFNIGLISWA
jgi:hypothetical protein